MQLLMPHRLCSALSVSPDYQTAVLYTEISPREANLGYTYEKNKGGGGGGGGGGGKKWHRKGGGGGGGDKCPPALDSLFVRQTFLHSIISSGSANKPSLSIITSRWLSDASKITRLPYHEREKGINRVTSYVIEHAQNLHTCMITTSEHLTENQIAFGDRSYTVFLYTLRNKYASFWGGKFAQVWN